MESEAPDHNRWLEVLRTYGSETEAHELDGRIRVLAHRATTAIDRLADTYASRATRNAGSSLGSEEIPAAME